VYEKIGLFTQAKTTTEHVSSNWKAVAFRDIAITEAQSGYIEEAQKLYRKFQTQIVFLLIS
jgi:hypothetical protein